MKAGPFVADFDAVVSGKETKKFVECLKEEGGGFFLSVFFLFLYLGHNYFKKIKILSILNLSF